MTEEMKPLDLGFEPEAAVSGAVLFQSEYSTRLICNATRKVDGKWKSAGTGVIEFEICTLTKFGYPNDEAWAAIPRTRGLSYGFYEVIGSAWPVEVARLNRYAFPTSTTASEQRHFIALFHDSSFECLARAWTSRLSTAPIGELVGQISAEIAQE